MQWIIECAFCPRRMPGSLFLFLAFFIFLLPHPSHADDKPFNNAANWGGTGLLETPNARVLNDGQMRIGYAHAAPYDWYVFGIGFLPRLETSFRFTAIENVPEILGPDYGKYKDKAFDLKLQLVKESRDFPAIALGLQDIGGGTEFFEAQYLAISRQIYPFDFTMGIGTERLNGGSAFSHDLGLFGGVEVAITDRLTAAVEYNPIHYQDDAPPVRAIPAGADAPINCGLRMRVYNGLLLGLSYQRGNTFGLMANLTFPLGKPLLPKKPSPPDWRFLIHEIRQPIARGQIVENVLVDLKKTGAYRNIYVVIQGRRLIADLENQRYLSNAKAAGRAFRILLYHADRQIDTLVVRLSRRSIPILSIAAAPENVKNFLTGKLSADMFKELIDVAPAAELKSEPICISEAAEKPAWLSDYGVKPQIETLFNDPSGVIKTRASLQPYLTLTPWKGNALAARLDFPLYSDIDSSVATPPDAVRSDFWQYAGTSPTIDYLLSDQVLKLSERVYTRLSIGYLERMYTGVSSELLTFVGNGSFAAGAGVDWVRKREPKTFFELQNSQYYSALANFYYFFNPFNLTLQASAGRFLAGDKGARFQVTRQYDTFARVGFWYSLTDTSHLTDFNAGYHDKGFFVQIPMEMFFTFENRALFGYRIMPWTRDVAATVDHWEDLYGFAGDLTPDRFMNEIEAFDN